jgi:hypothetical protein
MAAGEDDFRSAAFIFHRKHIGTDAVADVVILALDSLAIRHDALEFSEVDHDIIALEAADGAGNDVASAVLELLVNHFLLRLAEALHHCLFGSLYGDAAEVLGSDVEFLCIADLCSRVFFSRGSKRNLIEFVVMVVIGDDGEDSVNLRFALFGIHRGAQRLNRISTRHHLTIGGNEGEFQRGNDLVAVDSFFLFVILNEGDDIVGHGVLCLRSALLMSGDAKEWVRDPLLSFVRSCAERS